MKKARAARVPVLENAFEVHLPKLMRMAKVADESRVVLDDGDVRTVAIVTQTRLAVFLGGRPWVVEIVSVKCLKDRSRLLMRCPRAHEGNFQSLYYQSGELACRRCHALRYRTNLASTPAVRDRIRYFKFLAKFGNTSQCTSLNRKRGEWRSKFLRNALQLDRLSHTHYGALFQSWPKGD
jgi:hypothetical protein